jgi:uncharacterized RDD family membrane protein YckC
VPVRMSVAASVVGDRARLPAPRDNLVVAKSQPDRLAPALTLAPLWKRSLASIINVASVIGVAAAAVPVVAAPIYALGEYDEQALDRARARLDAWRKRRSARSSAARSLGPIGLVWVIDGRNRPSYGHRVMGIRRVDASDGGPITVTGIIVHYVASELIRTLVPDESRVAEEQRKERLRAVTPELVALWKNPSRTRLASARESLTLLRKRRANPLAPTLRTAAIRLAIHLVPIVIFPRRQSLPDFAAGIVTATSGP